MHTRSNAYISALPHPGPPPTCPLPPLPTMKATPAKRRQPATAHKKASPPVVKLPEGYAFIPPSVPLTYPTTYHLIPAGPMNAAPKHKRAVFRTLTNLTERVRLSKRKQPQVDLADESFCCRGGEMLNEPDATGDGPSGCGRNVHTVAGFGLHFEPNSPQLGDTYGGGDGSLVGLLPRVFRWSVTTLIWALGVHQRFMRT
ncbi:hypothetical protein B0H19DRAFT_1267466 [Mycena capillaripes]|nr:hypothetical protein B0H19DRAFT_1267466 [Mycena capillaripes]